MTAYQVGCRVWDVGVQDPVCLSRIEDRLIRQNPDKDPAAIRYSFRVGILTAEDQYYLKWGPHCYYRGGIDANHPSLIGLGEHPLV